MNAFGTYSSPSKLLLTGMIAFPICFHCASKNASKHLHHVIHPQWEEAYHHLSEEPTEAADVLQRHVSPLMFLISLGNVSSLCPNS